MKAREMDMERWSRFVHDKVNECINELLIDLVGGFEYEEEIEAGLVSELPWPYEETLEGNTMDVADSIIDILKYYFDEYQKASEQDCIEADVTYLIGDAIRDIFVKHGDGGQLSIGSTIDFDMITDNFKAELVKCVLEAKRDAYEARKQEADAEAEQECECQEIAKPVDERISYRTARAEKDDLNFILKTTEIKWSDGSFTCNEKITGYYYGEQSDEMDEHFKESGVVMDLFDFRCSEKA